MISGNLTKLLKNCQCFDILLEVNCSKENVKTCKCYDNLDVSYNYTELMIERMDVLFIDDLHSNLLFVILLTDMGY